MSKAANFSLKHFLKPFASRFKFRAESKPATNPTAPPLFIYRVHAAARFFPSTHPVEVVEGGPELVELLLADALGVPRQDLVLDLVDGAGDGGEQLLPAHADVLRHRRRHRGGGRSSGRQRV